MNRICTVRGFDKGLFRPGEEPLKNEEKQMRLLFLGTAAAEGIPALWCDCECCRESRRLGGRNIRHRCSYCIDSDTLVDFGPDSGCRTLDCNVELARIKRLIVTHPHSDHLVPAELMYRHMPRFCASAPEGKMALLGSEEVLGEFVRGVLAAPGAGYSASDLFDDLRLDPLTLRGGEWTSSDDMEVLPIPAAHAPGLGAMIFVIRRGGRALLIANDTAFLPEASWAMLNGVKLDAAVLECTLGFSRNISGRHMGIDATLRFRDRLGVMGCLDMDTPVFANHFSHNGGGTYDELSRAFAPSGITVAYDGLTVEV